MLFATVVVAIATIVLAVATIVLARVTAYYAKQTNRMVVEMQQQRNDAALTFIAFKHSDESDQENGNKAARHRIINHGPGVALQIHARIGFLQANGRGERIQESKSYHIPALGPGGDQEIHLDLANHNINSFEADYTDVYCRKLQVEQVITYGYAGEATYRIHGKQLQ